MRLSVDETIARGLNSWRNWTCSAGVKNLYIDYDGNLWVCNTASAAVNRFNYEAFEQQKKELFERADPEKVWDEFEKLKVRFRKSDISVSKVFSSQNEKGLLGNIFNGFEIPDKWFNCEWNLCGCGADVFIPKAQSKEDIAKLSVHNYGFAGRDSSTNDLVDQIEKSVAVEPNFPISYQILWDLGRRCNYDCSYCWPSAHNRDAEHKPLKVMIDTADKLISSWSFGSQIRWNFGGGEPTLNPDFLEFVKYLHSRNQWVLVTTNGSRPRSYWKEAIKYINSVNLSVHFEFSKDQRILENIEEICDYFDKHNADHWLEIKLMSPPQFVQNALALKEKIKELTKLKDFGANGRIKGVVSIVPIRSSDGSTLIEYTEEDMKLIQNQ